MRQHQSTVTVRTKGRGLVDITPVAAELAPPASRVLAPIRRCRRSKLRRYLVQENADPAARRDIERFLERLAPEGAGYEHTAEGLDDSPSHLRSAVTRTSETIPVSGGVLALGTWQAIWLCEHRARPHARSLIVHVTGE